MNTSHLAVLMGDKCLIPNLGLRTRQFSESCGLHSLNIPDHGHRPKIKKCKMLYTLIYISLENKTLICKCILKPIWTYGIELWGCAKPSNTKIIQRLQSNVLRTITNAPWFVSNFTLHNDLQIPLITEEIKR
jgi:hypothetical protein